MFAGQNAERLEQSCRELWHVWNCILVSASLCKKKLKMDIRSADMNDSESAEVSSS